MNYYDGIIFDLDGTLWQTRDSYIYAYHKILESHPEMKTEYTDQEIISTMGLTLENVGDIVFSLFDSTKRLEIMIEGLKYSCEYLLSYPSTIYPNVIDTIISLSKTTKLFIVSNCPKEYLDTFFVKSNLKDYFTDYRFLTLDTNKKLNVSNLVKENKLNRVLMVGDSIDDYEAVKDGSIDYAFCEYGYRKCDNYQYAISDFKEIIDIISFVNFRKSVLQNAKHYELLKTNDAQVVLMKNEFQKDSDYIFGFWRYSKNKDNNKILFEKLENRVKELNIKELIGPIDYTTWFKYRLAIDNFDWNLYPDIANDENQVEFLKSFGYKIKMKYSSTLTKLDKNYWKLCKKAKLSDDYEIKTYKGEVPLHVIKDIYEISLDCFKDAYLYSPINFDSFQKLYLQGINLVYPVVVLIYHMNRPIAFSFCYPNLDSKFYVSKTTGIKKLYQSSRVILKLVDFAYQNMNELGYDDVLYHFQNEEKNVDRLWRKNVIRQKHYALFIKEFK